MVRLLKVFVGAVSLAAVTAHGAEIGSNHTVDVELRMNLVDVSTPFESWPDGGLSKLRFDQSDDGLAGGQLLGEYRGLLKPTLSVAAAFDFSDDGTGDAGLTEAYLTWRPVPRSPNQHRFRFGAFYPPFSRENGDAAWSNPFTLNFSTINAWLAEEIRPIGAEWSIERKIGFAGSPHSFKSFAAVFYGNDPAGTLLFWRGFGLHNRQTQLNERIRLSDIYLPGQSNPITGRYLDPIAEIDDRPGVYLGAEWTYFQKASVQLAFYDNRADAMALRDGQWAWGTRFLNLTGQYELPGRIGLIAQWMRGDTDWMIGALPDGSLLPFARIVTDEFEAWSLLVAKRLSDRHQITLRRDGFDLWRPGEIDIDVGSGWTLGYRFEASTRLSLRAEWLEIESRRDIWPLFNMSQPEATESLLQLQFVYQL